MRRSILMLAVVFSAVVIHCASASLYIIEADEFDSGTNISNIVDDITLSVKVPHQPWRDPVHTVASTQLGGKLGSYVFGHAGDELWPNGYWLRADFAQYANYASIRVQGIIPGDVMVVALDSGGTELDVDYI